MNTSTTPSTTTTTRPGDFIVAGKGKHAGTKLSDVDDHYLAYYLWKHPASTTRLQSWTTSPNAVLSPSLPRMTPGSHHQTPLHSSATRRPQAKTSLTPFSSVAPLATTE